MVAVTHLPARLSSSIIHMAHNGCQVERYTNSRTQITVFIIFPLLQAVTPTPMTASEQFPYFRFIFLCFIREWKELMKDKLHLDLFFWVIIGHLKAPLWVAAFTFVYRGFGTERTGK